jgi:hypothetical protein
VRRVGVVRIKILIVGQARRLPVWTMAGGAPALQFSGSALQKAALQTQSAFEQLQILGPRNFDRAEL